MTVRETGAFPISRHPQTALMISIDLIWAYLTTFTQSENVGVGDPTPQECNLALETRFALALI
jgi:hypothetical protein